MSEETPNPVGRPTDYRPEHCGKVVEWGKQGKSKAWMCAELDCTPQTMDNWAAANPEFLEAITRAVIHSQKWWEDNGQENLKTAGYQASMWSRSMAARFPNDWRETSRNEHTGVKDGPPIKTEDNALALLTSRIAGLSARTEAERSPEGTE